ncbi:hypothetical protein DY000_02046649 [Brassica cretica]|uniref:Uncharacterized protein n=1 Tax=Brassica cretica TaxID=69181 RepID=A0ABQ7ER87_BRACR|nr:hypothetical protein DY000_02046649 [Brassica cretica]
MRLTACIFRLICLSVSQPQPPRLAPHSPDLVCWIKREGGVSIQHDAPPSPLLAALARRVPEELWAVKQGLRLLQERANADSFWWPYISNLPETYTVPIFFHPEDIENLPLKPFQYKVRLDDLIGLSYYQLKRHQMLHDNDKLSSLSLVSKALISMMGLFKLVYF